MSQSLSWFLRHPSLRNIDPEEEIVFEELNALVEDDLPSTSVMSSDDPLAERKARIADSFTMARALAKIEELTLTQEDVMEADGVDILSMAKTFSILAVTSQKDSEMETSFSSLSLEREKPCGSGFDVTMSTFWPSIAAATFQNKTLNLRDDAPHPPFRKQKAFNTPSSKVKAKRTSRTSPYPLPPRRPQARKPTTAMEKIDKWWEGEFGEDSGDTL